MIRDERNLGVGGHDPIECVRNQVISDSSGARKYAIKLAFIHLEDRCGRMQRRLSSGLGGSLAVPGDEIAEMEAEGLLPLFRGVSSPSGKNISNALTRCQMGHPVVKGTRKAP